MYRRSKKYQQQIANSASVRAERERKLLGLTTPVQKKFPKLRRVIEITDFDSGTPMTHRIELYRSDRIDCYKVNIDGQLWKQRMVSPFLPFGHATDYSAHLVLPPSAPAKRQKLFCRLSFRHASAPEFWVPASLLLYAVKIRLLF